jgi:4-hydroxybenzoate polyprenyltransferase
MNGRFASHLKIARLDHWFKQVFCLPGALMAVILDDLVVSRTMFADLTFAMAGVSLVASSNYVLNELIDAPFDSHHPGKSQRPVVMGRINIPGAWTQWLVLAALGLALCESAGRPVALSAMALWGMGAIYNIPPVRSKDLPLIDVLSESVNNPLRLMIGWYAIGGTDLPPLSLLLSYWAIGGFLMAAKRSAELASLGDGAPAYRRSFGWYTPSRLDALMVFCVVSASFLGGVFIALHRLELVLAFPAVALVLAWYWLLALQVDSPVQAPEGLWKNMQLMGLCLLAAGLVGVLSVVDLPWLAKLFDVQAT